MIETVPVTVAAATLEQVMRERDQARRIAIQLEQQCSQAVLLLEAVAGAVADMGSAALWQHPAVVKALFFIADLAEASP